jgi:transposase
MRKPYRTDPTDDQWKLIKPLVTAAKSGGPPREVDMREILNSLLHSARTDCQWDLLPHGLLPKNTVWDYFAAWRDDDTWRRIVDALLQHPHPCRVLPQRGWSTCSTSGSTCRASRLPSQPWSSSARRPRSQLELPEREVPKITRTHYAEHHVQDPKARTAKCIRAREKGLKDWFGDGGRKRRRLTGTWRPRDDEAQRRLVGRLE